MSLKYKINCLLSLKEKGYNTTALRKYKLLGESEIQKLRNNEIIGIHALEKLCELLELQPGDIIEYISDDDNGENK